jgi:hypothetical protein
MRKTDTGLAQLRQYALFELGAVLSSRGHKHFLC